MNKLLFWLIVRCKKDETMNQIFSDLNLKNEIVAKYIDCNIIKTLLDEYNLDRLKKIFSIIGNDHSQFTESVSSLNKYHRNALEDAIFNKKTDFYKYLLSITPVKSFYDSSNKENGDAIYRMLYILFIHCSNDEVIDEVFKALNFDKKFISEYIDYKYQNPKHEFDDAAIKYEEWNIVGNVLKLQTLDRLKKLTEFISEQQLIEGALVSDKNGKNGFEYALCKKQIDVVKFLMNYKYEETNDDLIDAALMEMDVSNESMAESTKNDKAFKDFNINQSMIGQMFVLNKVLLWRSVYWMTAEYEKLIASYLMNELNLNEAILRELKSFKFSKSENDEKFAYADKKISDEAIAKLLDLTKK